MLKRVALIWGLGISCAFAQVRLEAPATAKVGSEIAITVSGAPLNVRDFVTLVPKGSREGLYQDYQYTPKPGVFKLIAPPEPGDYEIRLLGATTPYPTLARRALVLENVTATLEAPAQVSAGTTFEVKWTGPNNERDYVGIGTADVAKRPYITYVYTRNGSPISLNAPDEPGDYEVRYFLGQGNKIVASRRITVGGVTASVSAPAQVAAGASFAIDWQGPNNARDFITLVKAGTAEKQYERYAYTAKGSPLQLQAPDQPGDYEVRYLTAQSYATLAATKVKVTTVNGSVQAPAEALAGSTFPVTWKGPNNHNDYITIVLKGAREGESGNYAYTARGNPAKVLAPLAAGEYEVRYSTGQSHATLARTAIRITPGKEEPGFVTVTTATAMAAGSAVEIILDASGSMLQRLGGQRRIDIAKQTLTRLTSATIPAGTPFAMRVFGRELDSCQTDLEIPLGALNAAAVAAKIAALEAKNNAKTPIGASLDQVANDLSAAKGERLVVLLTDGEETCGGDPAAAITKLKQSGVSVRVNIVGFAIDDATLATTFKHWADTGGGMFFDAKDAAGLDKALSQAMRSGFEIVNAQGQAVAEGLAGGEPVRVMPGNYNVRIKGQPNRAQPVTVRPKETAAVRF
jgi:hypothetical protein